MLKRLNMSNKKAQTSCNQKVVWLDFLAVFFRSAKRHNLSRLMIHDKTILKVNSLRLNPKNRIVIPSVQTRSVSSLMSHLGLESHIDLPLRHVVKLVHINLSNNLKLQIFMMSIMWQPISHSRINRLL